MFADQTLEVHAAGRIEQARTDLALLERRNEDALGAVQQFGEPALAIDQRQVRRDEAMVLVL